MNPKRIILLRHGESEGNVDKDVYSHTPDHKIALTSKGLMQAFTAGEEIRKIIGMESIHAYVSPYLRTRQTLAEAAKGLKILKSHEDPRLREQEWGNFRSPEDTEKFQKVRYEYGPFYYRFPDGESGADVYDRVSTFFETLFRDFKNENYPTNTLIVTHGLTIRLFLMRWYHNGVDTFEKWKNPRNCQFFVMHSSLESGQFILETPLELEDAG